MTKPKRTYKIKPLSDAISKVYRKASNKNDAQFLNLIKNWKSIVGEEYSNILSPLNIISNSSTLVILSQRKFSLEADYIAPMLLEKINAFYGYKSFKKIKFIFHAKNSIVQKEDSNAKNINLSKIEGFVCNIENDALKEALSSLGKSMSQKGKL